MAKRRDSYNSMTWDIDWFDDAWLDEEFNTRDVTINSLQIDVWNLQTNVWNLQTDVWNIETKLTAWYTWTFIVDWKTLTFSEWLLTSVI